MRSQTETPKRYRYTGKERDEETGLSYHGARYYAPWLGRWVSCDPAGLDDGVNVYLYAHANPLVLIDPSGMGSVMGATEGEIPKLTGPDPTPPPAKPRTNTPPTITTPTVQVSDFEEGGTGGGDPGTDEPGPDAHMGPPIEDDRIKPEGMSDFARFLDWIGDENLEIAQNGMVLMSISALAIATGGLALEGAAAGAGVAGGASGGLTAGQLGRGGVSALGAWATKNQNSILNTLSNLGADVDIAGRELAYAQGPAKAALGNAKNAGAFDGLGKWGAEMLQMLSTGGKPGWQRIDNLADIAELAKARGVTFRDASRGLTALEKSATTDLMQQHWKTGSASDAGTLFHKLIKAKDRGPDRIVFGRVIEYKTSQSGISENSLKGALDQARRYAKERGLKEYTVIFFDAQLGAKLVFSGRL